jgi:hypothetical protein
MICDELKPKEVGRLAIALGWRWLLFAEHYHHALPLRHRIKSTMQASQLKTDVAVAADLSIYRSDRHGTRHEWLVPYVQLPAAVKPYGLKTSFVITSTGHGSFAFIETDGTFVTIVYSIRLIGRVSEPNSYRVKSGVKSVITQDKFMVSSTSVPLMMVHKRYDELFFSMDPGYDSDFWWLYSHRLADHDQMRAAHLKNHKEIRRSIRKNGVCILLSKG